MAIILDGKALALEIKAELKTRVDKLKASGRQVGLAAVLVGDNPASEVYVRNKAKFSEEIGVFSEIVRPPGNITTIGLITVILALNDRADITGIIVQSPLPKKINEREVSEGIFSGKDVDGFHPQNMGRLVLGRPGFVPCTPAAILEILNRYGHSPAGKHCVIVGRGNIVGKPLSIMLLEKSIGNATVTVCHSATRDLASHTRRADILIAATGSPLLIKGDMVREGAVVIDVGINRIEDKSSPKGYRLVGDVDFDSVSKKAAAITPVPGGVGPMTVAMLLSNTVRAAERARK
ncbi:MAG: bifunctional 5,10-methylenetetrahydrofolate dehydrogenase/5,10-methenyltetrahydrofolate cyclohydrolase [candidate division Zixibacteria bacterium]|nr:bifunctional 5,10-methylenetetrahydrofolate dehydrogenase/5,10-methenyltetrahydrofolate cyclohydrolase [candidate division Zixibacteria bacterium]